MQLSTIIVLEKLPRFLRGTVTAQIRNSMPAAVQARSIALYQDDALWRRRLSVTDANRAYVLLLDRQGRITWQNSGKFTDASYTQLQAAHEALRQNAHHP